MHSRCTPGANPANKNYGNRGISVCEEWNDFAVFSEWATANGYRDDLTIDRKDNNKGYCPENCRWSDRIEQANNTGRNHLVSYNGETRTISEWSRITRIKYHTLLHRINKYNWSAERALTTPAKESNK